MFGLGGIFEKWMDGAVKDKELKERSEEFIRKLYQARNWKARRKEGKSLPMTHIPDYSKMYPPPIIMSYDDWMNAGCPSAIVKFKYELSSQPQWQELFNKQKETKMTRQEAIDKLKSVKPKQDHDGFIIKASVLVDGLEALGLIKFEEEKKETKLEDILVNPRAIVEILNANGYHIVKLGKNTTVKLAFGTQVELGKINGKLLEIDQEKEI